MNWKRWILVGLLAFISGIGIAAWRIAGITHSPSYHTFGAWHGTTDLPLNRDDLVTTQVTLFALFALPSQEAVYLFSSADKYEKALSGSSIYQVSGNIHDIKAEYWSITAYGRDLYLMPNAAERYSFNRDNLQTDSAGNYVITLSDSASSGNWLPVQKDKKFELVLRIYHGDPDFMAHLDKASLPAIRNLNYYYAP